ncbi:MAG: glycosyltransferase [Fusobacteriaceae bacterium]
MDKLKLSIAFLTYNHEKYIKKALDSILNQKFDYKYEIVIGEDFSTDKTREILMEYKKKYPKKIKLIFRDKNIGITANFSDILKNCKGEYIALLEGDDYWIDKDKLRKQVDFLEKNKNYIGAAHENILIDQNDNILSKENLKIKNDTIFTLKKLAKNGLLYQTASLLFRNIFIDNLIEVKLIKEINSKVGDLTLAIILLQKGNIYLMKKKMSAYRIDITNNSSSSSATAHKNLKFFYEEYLNYIDRLEEYLKYEVELSYLKSTILVGFFIYSIKNKMLSIFLRDEIYRKKTKISKKVLICCIKILIKIIWNKIKLGIKGYR